jgi:hypothetical protein
MSDQNMGCSDTMSDRVFRIISELWSRDTENEKNIYEKTVKVKFILLKFLK